MKDFKGRELNVGDHVVYAYTSMGTVRMAEGHVTKIYKTHKSVDTYFPNLDNMENWNLAYQSKIFALPSSWCF